MQVSSRAEITVFQSFNSFRLKLFYLNTRQRKQFLNLITKQKALGLFVGNYADATKKPKIVIGYEVRSGSKEKTEQLIRLIEEFCAEYNIPLKQKFDMMNLEHEKYWKANN